MDYSTIFKKLQRFQKKAYAPYSKYKVASAVLANNKLYFGVNVENAVYPLSVCAERNAIANAVVNNQQTIDAVYLLTDSTSQNIFGTPCGACRQVIYEFAKNKKIPIVVYNQEGKYKIFKLDQLLPDAWEF